MQNKRILAISGSLRTGSFNSAILSTLRTALAGRVTLDLFPIGDIPLYNQDLDSTPAIAPVASLRRAIAQADGLVIASPEYNHGMPGVLKNLLDWASRPTGQSTLTGKPVLIFTASPGAVGGARAHAQLNETLASIGARTVLRPQAVIPFVRDKIVDGRLTDPLTLDFLFGAVDDLLREIARPGSAITEQS